MNKQAYFKMMGLEKETGMNKEAMVKEAGPRAWLQGAKNIGKKIKTGFQEITKQPETPYPVRTQVPKNRVTHSLADAIKVGWNDLKSFYSNPVPQLRQYWSDVKKSLNGHPQGWDAGGWRGSVPLNQAFKYQRAQDSGKRNKYLNLNAPIPKDRSLWPSKGQFAMDRNTQMLRAFFGKKPIKGYQPIPSK